MMIKIRAGDCESQVTYRGQCGLIQQCWNPWEYSAHGDHPIQLRNQLEKERKDRKELEQDKQTEKKNKQVKRYDATWLITEIE